MAQTLRSECGRYCIEPGLEKVIKADGLAGEDFFSVDEVLMRVSVKNPDTEKKEYVDQKRHIVYCNDIDKVSPSLKVKVLFKNQFFFELPLE